MPTLIPRNQLLGPPTGQQFVGADHGDIPISLFLVDARPGTGPELHRHPYPEVFILHAGQADFQIGATHLTASAGDVVIAPAGNAHRLTSIGNGQLRLTAIHTASTRDTEWLTTHAIPMPDRTSVD
jgi:quercetin dioxygenase-like cupin family protein